MKKLLTITMLLTTLISCSQGIEEYSCSFMEQDKTKIYTHYFTFDTKNDLWNSDGDWSYKEHQQGRISQKNDYFYELSVRDFFWGNEYPYYVFDRKKKKLYDARRWLENNYDIPYDERTPLENLDIAYFTSYYNEDEKYFNCK